MHIPHSREYKVQNETKDKRHNGDIKCGDNLSFSIHLSAAEQSGRKILLLNNIHQKPLMNQKSGRGTSSNLASFPWSLNLDPRTVFETPNRDLPTNNETSMTDLTRDPAVHQLELPT